MKKLHRNILCIDLKSFFASVECIEKNLDPFTTPLVVANKSQGNGAITLAVSPYLKTLGIPGRTRLYQIPKNIKYIIAPPRMKLYIKKSKEIINIYLSFISKEDLHIYSIDECFLDVTDYLHYYKTNDIELAKKILDTIKERTGLTATCGIGPNMVLAKIAMDIESKHTKDNLAKWDYEDIPTKLWPITPLSKVWGIGPRLEKRLNLIGINKIEDLAKSDCFYLKNKFGVLGEELWYRANGIDNSIIREFKDSPQKSIGHSQILMKDYYNDAILLIIKEMMEVLTERLRYSNLETGNVGFSLGYSKAVGGGFHHQLKLNNSTDDTLELYNYCKDMFEKYYEENMPIRRVAISLGALSPKKGIQLNLFNDLDNQLKEDKIKHTVDEIKARFGKNSILNTTSLLPNSTAKERNQKIGGHHE